MTLSSPASTLRYSISPTVKVSPVVSSPMVTALSVTSTVISPLVAVMTLPLAVTGIFIGALIVPLVRVIEVTLLIVGLVPVLSIVNAFEAVTLNVALPAMRFEPAILSGRVAVTPLTVMLVGMVSELARVIV